MLLFKGPRDQLLAPLQAVCGIVEKRHTLPILSNVLMEKNGEKLTLLGYGYRDSDHDSDTDTG
jgi:DNA polymerase-3 subunit beta